MILSCFKLLGFILDLLIGLLLVRVAQNSLSMSMVFLLFGFIQHVDRVEDVDYHIICLF